MRSDMPTELLEKDPGNSKPTTPWTAFKDRTGAEIQGGPDEWHDKAASESASGDHVRSHRLISPPVCRTK